MSHSRVRARHESRVRMAGMKVVVVKNDPSTGAIDVEDLEAKRTSTDNRKLMITYPPPTESSRRT